VWDFFSITGEEIAEVGNPCFSIVILSKYTCRESSPCLIKELYSPKTTARSIVVYPVAALMFLFAEHPFTQRNSSTKEKNERSGQMTTHFKLKKSKHKDRQGRKEKNYFLMQNHP